MASFTVSFGSESETVNAHYYQHEDGWFHFKDNDGGQVASYRGEDVVSISRVSEAASGGPTIVIHGKLSTENVERVTDEALRSAGLYR